MNIETTKDNIDHNTALVNLQDLPELQGYSTFTLKTNTTVYLSLKVWDYDKGIGNNDKIRDIDNLVIPFNEITKNNDWTDKRFPLSDGAYLEIQFRISACYSTTGLGCNFCIENYYTSLCNKLCKPVQGSYTCSTSGDKLCAEHKTGENCDMCQKEWSGEQCEECAENYFPENVCDVTCIAVEGRYTCSNIGKKVCNENWKGVECDTCAEHRIGETCEECSEGWGGNACQECAKDYYPEGVCNVTCTEETNNFTCKEDGRKECYKNWKGEECDNCSEEYFGEFCDKFCKETGHYDCSLTGEKVCFDNTTTVENNCQKFSKLSKKYKIIIGAASGTTVLAVIFFVGIILMRKKNNTSHTSQLVEKTNTKHTKLEKSTGASKSGQSSKEMTYATLNHSSSDRKYAENEESFQNTGFVEADMSYATLNREVEHSIEDTYEQSNYTHVVNKTRQTHIKKGKENVNQGDPQTGDFKEEDAYSIVVKKFGPNIESEKKFEQLVSHGPELSSGNEEDVYSLPIKSKSSIKDCCKVELEEEKAYADMTILGQKEKEEPHEAAEDNEEECMYADVSFVGKRKEFGMQEDNEAPTSIHEKDGSAVYFTMGDTRD